MKVCLFNDFLSIHHSTMIPLDYYSPFYIRILVFLVNSGLFFFFFFSFFANLISLFFCSFRQHLPYLMKMRKWKRDCTRVLDFYSISRTNDRKYISDEDFIPLFNTFSLIQTFCCDWVFLSNTLYYFWNLS